MSAELPYPNPFEILRYILRGFDLKQSNKRLDDLAAKRIYDPRQLPLAIKTYLFDVAQKNMGQPTAEIVSKAISDFYAYYLIEIVGKVPADNVSRAFTLELLLQTCIKDHLVQLVTRLHREIEAPHPSFWFSNNTSSVGALFNWLNEHEQNWGSFLSSLKKERRDMLRSWGNGKELPSAQSIRLLSKPDKPSESERFEVNWQRVKPLVFIARAIDFIRQEPLGGLLIEETRLAIWGADNRVSFASEILSIQSRVLESIGPDQNLIAILQHDLRRTVTKVDPTKYQDLIRQATLLIQRTIQLQPSQYWIDWHDARWHVFSGDLQGANELYKVAFESALFSAGKNQQQIAEEAIVVAASQPNPDRVFLKQLKWSLISFGYDIASHSHSKPSQKATDTIEEWELDLWKSNFDRVFPKKGLFPGVDYRSDNKVVGPLVVGNLSEIKPDFRHPDRTIKTGETWQRSMPQLVWFALHRNIDVCRKLIERGANVNVASEVGDTPLLMALEELNVTEVPLRSLNDELYQLIKKEQHTVKTVNTRTQKKRLLPIISAVQSGKPEIVQDLLSMGADPNGRGDTDEQTPLNVCLKLICILKKPVFFKKHQASMPITPEVLDSIRRYSNGLSGFTMEDQQRALRRVKQTRFYKLAGSQYIDTMCENIHKHMNISSIREIAKILIRSGADVNAEHASPLKGYTPLMLAVEVDERELFELMLIHGGDLKKTYNDPDTEKKVSVYEIAHSFESVGVLQVLNDISQYITVH